MRILSFIFQLMTSQYVYKENLFYYLKETINICNLDTEWVNTYLQSLINSNISTYFYNFCTFNFLLFHDEKSFNYLELLNFLHLLEIEFLQFS